MSIIAQFDKKVEYTLDEPRDYDLIYTLPDWELTRYHRQPVPTWPVRDWVRMSDGTRKYIHLSRVEWNEIELGHRIYKPDGSGQLLGGLPPTCQWLPSGSIGITGTTAGDFWFEVFKKHKPHDMSDSEALLAWLGFTADGICFTDRTGGHAMNSVSTTGNVWYYLGLADIGGQQQYKVKLLQIGSLEYMREQLRGYPLLEQKATYSTRAYEGRGVEPFHHLEGNQCSYLPLSKAAVGYIPVSRARKLGRSEKIPNSFWPAQFIG